MPRGCGKGGRLQQGRGLSYTTPCNLILYIRTKVSQPSSQRTPLSTSLCDTGFPVMRVWSQEESISYSHADFNVLMQTFDFHPRGSHRNSRSPPPQTFAVDFFLGIDQHVCLQTAGPPVSVVHDRSRSLLLRSKSERSKKHYGITYTAHTYKEGIDIIN